MTIQLKNTLIPDQIDVEIFLQKLTAHEETKSYVGVSPLNIIQINNNNFANLQTQISGIDISYMGNFLVQYPDSIVVYDYENDAVRGNVNFQQPAALPDDFFIKLSAHPELGDLQNERPVGGPLDAQSLNTLKQQFPDVYKDAKVGDFLLRFQSKLIIYDYNNDRVVTVANIS